MDDIPNLRRPENSIHAGESGVHDSAVRHLGTMHDVGIAQEAHSMSPGAMCDRKRRNALTSTETLDAEPMRDASFTASCLGSSGDVPPVVYPQRAIRSKRPSHDGLVLGRSTVSVSMR